MRQLAHVVPAALIQMLRGTPLSDGKVAFAWRTAVGPGIERSTTARIEGRVFIVETAGPQWTREIERSSDVILARLRSLLGTDAVARLDIRTK